MVEVKLLRGTKASLDATPIVDGQILVTTDDGRIFIDTDKDGALERVEVAKSTAIFIQDDEPVGAPDFSLWIDTDDEAVVLAAAEGVEF